MECCDQHVCVCVSVCVCLFAKLPFTCYSRNREYIPFLNTRTRTCGTVTPGRSLMSVNGLVKKLQQILISLTRGGVIIALTVSLQSFYFFLNKFPSAGWCRKGGMYILYVNILLNHGFFLSRYPPVGERSIAINLSVCVCLSVSLCLPVCLSVCLWKNRNHGLIVCNGTCGYFKAGVEFDVFGCLVLKDFSAESALS